MASDGTPQNSDAAYPSINADGSRVAFASFATNLVPDDDNGMFDVFVRDRTAGTTVSSVRRPTAPRATSPAYAGPQRER